MVSVIVSATSSSEFSSWSENRSNSGDLDSSRLSVLKCFQVVMECLVNISKGRAFWSLNEDILKIYYSDYQYAISIKEDTAYPCLHSPKTTKERRSIRHIQKKSRRRIEDIICEYSGRYQTCKKLQYAVSNPLDNPMDDANITIEEYIRLKEEKAQKRKKVFNWETAKYGKVWYDEDIHDLRFVETEFPVIAFIDEVSSEKTLSCEPTVSSLNDEIDFRVSFDDSDEEDYTVIFDKNSFSYKTISTIDLKTDSENDNEKVMPSLSSPEPTVSCFDYLDFFKDFENEFPAIVYNDAQTSKSDLLTEPILSPQHIDEFDLNDETSVSKYDKEEHNILYFNDLFPFNIIYLNDLKSEKDNEIDIIQSSKGNEITHGSNVEGYTEEVVHDFEQRLETIFARQVNRVHILDFEGLTPDMRQDLAERMRMVYIGDDGQEVFMSHAWRRFFRIRAPLVQEFILKFFSTCRIGDEMGLDVEMEEDEFGVYWLGSEQLIPDKGDLSDYWVEISSGRDFLRGAPSYTYIRDPVRRLCHRLISYSISGRGQAPEKVTATDLFYLCSMDRGAANVQYLLAQYLFRHVKGRKSSARLSGGHFIRRLAHHFGLVSNDGLRGLSVMARELPLIDMGELVVAAGAPKAAEDAPAVDEGGQAVPAPVLGRLEEEVQGLRRDVESLRGLMERLMTDQGRFSTWMISCMAELMDASRLTYQAFDGTFRGSSPAAFQRCTRQKTSEASTSTAQQDQQQPDP
ncbi:hypothetical protein Tco_0889298 [Tanacetum coccineum]